MTIAEPPVPMDFDKEIHRLTRRLDRERSARREAELIAEEATKVAIQDSLTGLANRSLVTSTLENELARAARYERDVALLFLDLDGFKLINDTYGHEMGDAVLIQVARELRLVTRAGDMVGRLGGDEFVVLAPNITCPDATQLANRVADAIGRMKVEGLPSDTGITASVGVTVLDGKDIDADRYLRQADSAMYEAKTSGADWRLYDAELDALAEHRRTIRRQLPIAIENDDFIVHYQPLVSLTEGAEAAPPVVGVEALVRWPNPDGSLRSPAEFIPIAEESGHIVGIGRRVIARAVGEISDWSGAHPDRGQIALSVNASPRELARADYAGQVHALLDRTELGERNLIIEITETAMYEGGAVAERNIRALQRTGIHLALDDFGTGYSAIGRLRQHAFDQLKIDRSFISGVADHADDRAVVAAIIAMARAFDMTVVAEGVETPEQLEVVRDLGCDLAQGFLFGRPSPLSALEPV